MEDLIAKLREYERLQNSSNPFQSQNVDSLSPVGQPVMNSTGIIDNSDDDYSNELMNRYMAHLDQMPVRKDPSVLQRILAGVAGIKNPDAAQNILYGGYNREVDDWKLAADAIGKGAINERSYNTNNRLLRSQTETERKNRALESDRAKRTANMEARTAIADFKANNPNSKIDYDEQGRIVAINPLTNKATYVTMGDGTPVDSRHMSKEDELNMQLEGHFKRMIKQGEITRSNQSAIEAERHANDLTEIGARGDQARQTKVVVPGGAAAATARGETQSARATRWINNANRLKAEHPEWSEYIHVDGRNVSIDAPKSGYFGKGPGDKEYNAIKAAIYDQETAKEGDISLPESDPINQQPVVEEASPVESAPVKAPTMTPAAKAVKETGVKRKELAPDVLKKAMAGVAPGKVLVTDGTNYGQMTLENARKLREPGWYVVGTK